MERTILNTLLIEKEATQITESYEVAAEEKVGTNLKSPLACQRHSTVSSITIR